MRTQLQAALLAVLGGVAPLHGQGLTSRAADPADVQTLDGIVTAFYDIVSGPAGEVRNWARDSTLYRADVRFTFTGGDGDQRRWQAVDHATFAAQAGPALARGFFEREIHRVVQEFGGMAHVFSTYAWSSPTAEGPERGRGINSIELIHEGGRWWITYAQWTEESPDQPIPPDYLPPAQR